MASFGIAESLEPGTPIYHTVFFNTIHSGRIADLVEAFLGKAFQRNPVQEFRMRNVIHLALFESYFSQLLMQKTDFTNPVILECGGDSQQIAIAISFIMSAENHLNLKDLASRINQRKPDSLFEDVLIKIKEQCDQLTLKHYPSSRRIEISAGILNETSASDYGPEKGSFNIIAYGPEMQPSIPPGQSYIDLGDLKFPKFITKEIFGTIESSNATDDFYSGKKNAGKTSFLSKIFGRKILGQAFNKDTIVVSADVTEPDAAKKVSSEEADYPDINDELLKLEASADEPTDLLSELETGKSEQIIEKIRDQLEKRDELKNTKAKKWLDGVLGALVADKMKLKYLARELNQSMLAREAAAKAQIVSLNSELIETKRLLNNEVAKNQLHADQQAAAERQAQKPTPSETAARHTRDEYAILRENHETVKAQLEDFKKTNRRLMERLNELTTPGSTANDSEAKKKLGAAMRLLSISRKETEGMKVFVEKLRSNEIALRKKIEELEK